MCVPKSDGDNYELGRLDERVAVEPLLRAVVALLTPAEGDACVELTPSAVLVRKITGYLDMTKILEAGRITL